MLQKQELYIRMQKAIILVVGSLDSTTKATLGNWVCMPTNISKTIRRCSKLTMMDMAQVQNGTQRRNANLFSTTSATGCSV